MVDNDYLTMRPVRLVGAEKWEPHGLGLCFVFVRGGSGTFAIRSVSHRLTRGDVMVLSRGGGGTIGAAGGGDLDFFSFSVLAEHMFPLFMDNEISHLQNLLDNFNWGRFHAASSPLAAECQRLIGITPPRHNLDHRAHVLGLVALLLSEEFKSPERARPDSGRTENMTQVFEQLSADELLGLSADELAARFGCSRRDLGRLFQQHFGFSIASLRRELRLLRATSLLRDASAKVGDVARMCGFRHLGLFNECFKQRFGTSPGRWRTLNPETPVTTKSQGGAGSKCLLEPNGLCARASRPPRVQVKAPARRRVQGNSAESTGLLSRASARLEPAPPVDPMVRVA